MRLTVTREERYWYPDDGGIVWLAGFVPIDPETGRFLSRDALRERGLIVAGAAGAHQFHDDVLQSAQVEPGAEVLLRRDPDNDHDPNAIAMGVHQGVTPRKGVHQGETPREGVAQGETPRGQHPKGVGRGVTPHGGHPAGGWAQLGWVPRDIAAELAPRIDAGEEWTAIVLREQRASPRDPRTGVTLLLASGPVELEVR